MANFDLGGIGLSQYLPIHHYKRYLLPALPQDLNFLISSGLMGTVLLHRSMLVTLRKAIATIKTGRDRADRGGPSYWRRERTGNLFW